MSEDIVVPSVKLWNEDDIIWAFTYPGKINLVQDADSVQFAVEDIPEPPKGITDDKVEELEERRMSDDGDGWIIDED